MFIIIGERKIFIYALAYNYVIKQFLELILNSEML